MGRPDFDKNKQNIATDEEYASTKVYENGFQSGKKISSKEMNSLLREMSLFIGAMLSYVNYDGKLSSEQANWSTDVASKLTAKIKKIIGDDYSFVKNTNSSGVTTFSFTINNTTNTLSLDVANKAITLNTARTIQVDLTSINSASFDGSSNITPGVSGILSVANGGTGKSDLSSVKVGFASNADNASKASDSDKFGGQLPSYYAKASDSAASKEDLENATNLNEPNKIVRRDANGDFKTHKIIADEFAGKLIGNASSSDKLNTTRTFTITDGTNSCNVSFDGSENVTFTLPSTLKIDISGNAATVTKLKTARKIKIANGTGTKVYASESFDGSADITLNLPADQLEVSASDYSTSSGNANKLGDKLPSAYERYTHIIELDRMNNTAKYHFNAVFTIVTNIKTQLTKNDIKAWLSKNALKGISVSGMMYISGEQKLFNIMRFNNNLLNVKSFTSVTDTFWMYTIDINDCDISDTVCDY